ncbi:SGNH/GDSL hydrolase family protein [uncultured Streptomyces sp.]|uniref:SGNH/GDSL hydrolase family protein n=1 Tax=uncultured Streptomyces sp. TaxID=174707 RepID=UPI00260A1CD8|nr:SGNH/GDSL hydrolase family protein [uncultured Streptomyces sp.]
MQTRPRTPLAAVSAALCTSLCAAGVLAAAAPVTSAAPRPPASAPAPLDYVALGDSFAAAPLVSPADPSNLLCVRSLADYPHVAAKALGARLTDVSCSAATAGDLSKPQHPGTRPQYEALNTGTDVVSITIGGNDTGLVAAALDCVNLLPEPVGSSCAARNTAGGSDKVKDGIDAWAPQFGTVLAEIRRRSPHADVFVIGYGNYIRPGGCFPVQPLWADDATYLQGAVNHLGAVLRDAAHDHGATFVDTYRLGIGHDACAAPADRHTEGFVPTDDAAPLHPNGKGAEAVGEALAAAVRVTR